MSNTQRFPVGTVYQSGGKHPRRCKVIDFLTTVNLAGDVVKTRYVSTSEFLGSTLTDYEVCETTIARGV